VQLTRLLQNLVANGLRYQRENVAPVIRVSAESQQDLWQFNVEDNGIGIAKEHLNQIFEPFKRLHTWQQKKGTGMGLAICNTIVENHGGKIWVTSEVGKGSVFHFTIRKPKAENT